jgi:hypothetical protein
MSIRIKHSVNLIQRNLSVKITHSSVFFSIRNLYRHQVVAHWLLYEKIFAKQTKSQILIEFYLLKRNRILRYPKSDSSVFVTSALCLDFFYLDSLMLRIPFLGLKCTGILKSSRLAPSMFLFWNCKNRMFWNTKLDSSIFSDLSNLVINTCLIHFS